MKKILAIILTFALFTAVLCGISVSAENTAPAYTVNICDNGDNTVTATVLFPEGVVVYAGNMLFTYNTAKLTLVKATSNIGGTINTNYTNTAEGVVGGVFHTFASTTGYGDQAVAFVMEFTVAAGQKVVEEDITYYRYLISNQDGIIASSRVDGHYMNFDMYYTVTYTNEDGDVVGTEDVLAGTTELNAPDAEGYVFDGFVSAPAAINACTTVVCKYVLYGDVNNDGHADPFDASLILRLDAMLINSLKCEAAADVNLDDKVNPFDASLILRKDAMLIPSLPYITE